MSARNPWKTEKLGTFSLGHENIELWVDPRLGGGTVTIQPDERALTRITVGPHDTLSELVATLLHEALELALSREGCRFCSDRSSDNAADCVFFADHQMFDRAVASSGAFLTDVFPKLVRLPAFRK